MHRNCRTNWAMCFRDRDLAFSGLIGISEQLVGISWRNRGANGQLTAKGSQLRNAPRPSFARFAEVHAHPAAVLYHNEYYNILI